MGKSATQTTAPPSRAEQTDLFAEAREPKRRNAWAGIDKWTADTMARLAELQAEAASRGWSLTVESGLWVARREGKRTLKAPSPEPVMRRIRSRGRASEAEQLPLFVVKIRPKKA